MKKFTLLLGGDLTVTERVRCQISDSFIIAVDQGIKHAKALGIEPDLWLGDFDSCNREDYPEFLNISFQDYIRDKDKTDGALAIEKALSQGAEALLLLGAFGGSRADHMFAHMTQMLALAHRAKFILSSGYCEALPLFCQEKSKAMTFDYEKGTQFSILSFDALKHLTIQGAKWCLDRANIDFGLTLTLSNEVEKDLKINLKAGRALLWVMFFEP